MFALGRGPAIMIKASSLLKQFGNIRAVDDVSFEVSRGEIYGLLGPNGAGKTTTIQMLAGALRPDSGSVSIGNGGNPALPDIREQIGSAPQALAIYQELTAEENLKFFGNLYGLHGRRLKEQVASCLELVGLTERRNSRVGTLSGGMQRRLNLACALVHEPPVLLLDEPTVGVDPQSRNLIFERIESLKERGLTLLYTTHYMDEAQRLCDRIAIMDRGKILAEGTVERIGPRSSWEITFPQAMQWALIGVCAAFAVGIVVERTRGTYLRLRLAPIGRFHILAGKGLACYIAALSVCCLLLAAGVLIFGVRIGSFKHLAMAMLSSGFCFVGLMMLISVLGKTEQAVGGAGWAILLVLSMTGGGMMPLFLMPGWMATIGSISAVKWSILAFEGAIWRGLSTEEMLKPIGILLGYGAVSFLAGLIVLRRMEQ